MAMTIKQGDAYAVPVKINLNGSPLDIQEVEEIEFYLGGYRKLYPGQVSLIGEEFNVPFTQEESLNWPEGEPVILDARVKFVGGNVQGIIKQKNIGVVDAVSEEVL